MTLPIRSACFPIFENFRPVLRNFQRDTKLFYTDEIEFMM